MGPAQYVCSSSCRLQLSLLLLCPCCTFCMYCEALLIRKSKQWFTSCSFFSGQPLSSTEQCFLRAAGSALKHVHLPSLFPRVLLGLITLLLGRV